MKRTLVLLLLTPFVLLCSCQKRDSAAEQQLAQRKAELDAREQALDEREKALANRERLAVKPRVRTLSQAAPTAEPQRSVAPVQPQRSVPPELQGLIADPSQARADREERMQERLAGRQRKLDELQRMRAARARPRVQATTSPTEDASPIASPTPE
jgi:hypothetical protein